EDGYGAGQRAFLDRAAQRGRELDRVVVADAERSIAPPLVARRPRHDLDRSRDGVPSVQRALRPAQYLDTLEVRQVQVRAREAAEVDVVDVDAHRRLGKVEARVLHAGAAGVNLDRLRP